MNELHDQPTPPTSDPLERLVEAFIGQSVPEGPDEARQRRLLVAIGAADAARHGTVELPPTSRFKQRSRTLLQQSAVLAAAIAVVVVGALSFANLGDNGPVVAVGTPGGSVEQPALADLANDAPLPQPVEFETTTASQEVARLFENYLRTHGGQRPDRQAFNAMLADYLKDHPELAKSESWRFAQDRLSYALEQPEFLGVGVGILGTLPWATVARF